MAVVDKSLLAAAQEAIRRGNRREARALLSTALKDNPQDYRIWLLLAGAAGSPRASLDYVERAARLQPGNATVARARAWAEARLAATAALEGPETSLSGADVTSMINQAGLAPTVTGRARKGRPPLRYVLVAILLVAIGVASSWAWVQRSSANRLPEAIAGQITTRVSPEATTEAGPNVVRGAFLPHREVPETVTPAPTATPVAFAIQRKLNQSGGSPHPTWTVTPSPTPTATPTPTIAPTFVGESALPQLVSRPASVGPNERWIDVNLTQQRLVAYEGDIPVFDTLVSSGTWNHPTVTGEFRVWLRFTSQTMDGSRLGYNYYLENVPYVMYFFEDYALHGTFWHNNFGTPMSHGCVNLPTPAAEWIFNWSSIGTLVRVHY